MQMGELQRRYREEPGQDHLFGQQKVAEMMPKLTWRSPSFPDQENKMSDKTCI